MKIRQAYDEQGVDGYYSKHSVDYFNPHVDYIKQLLSKIYISGTVIDFGCGDGLITKILMNDKSLSFIGIDKYMADRYSAETGYPSLSKDFKEIAIDFDLTANVCIASYVIDLIPKDLINQVVWNLSKSVDKFITIRPNSHRLSCDWLEETTHIKCGKSRLTEYRKK